MSRLPGLRVRSDVERKRIAGLLDLPPLPIREEDLYSRAMTERVYERLYNVAELILSSGENVILDAAFLRREERARCLALARRCEARCVIVHCTAPMDELRSRIERRLSEGRDPSDATLHVLDQQAQFVEPLTPQECAHAVIVHTGVATAITQVLDVVGAAEIHNSTQRS